MLLTILGKPLTKMKVGMNGAWAVGGVFSPSVSEFGVPNLGHLKRSNLSRLITVSQSSPQRVFNGVTGGC